MATSLQCLLLLSHLSPLWLSCLPLSLIRTHMDNVRYSPISRSLMKSHLQCPFGRIKWQTHRFQRWGRGHLWPKGIILSIAEDRHDYLRVCVCLYMSLASFLMAAMTCPLLLSFLRFPFPHLSFLFLVQILLRLQTSTHLHNLLHSLPCQAPVQSQISTGVVLISSPHEMCLFPHFYVARDGSTVHVWTLGGWESSCDYFWPKICQ